MLYIQVLDKGDANFIRSIYTFFSIWVLKEGLALPQLLSDCFWWVSVNNIIKKVSRPDPSKKRLEIFSAVNCSFTSKNWLDLTLDQATKSFRCIHHLDLLIFSKKWILDLLTALTTVRLLMQQYVRPNLCLVYLNPQSAFIWGDETQHEAPFFSKLLTLSSTSWGRGSPTAVDLILFCIISLLAAHHNTHTCGSHTQEKVNLYNKKHTICQYDKCSN